MKVLLTGGAGYIGSHACLELLKAQHEVYIVDNLSNSNIESINKIQEFIKSNIFFTKCDIADFNSLNSVFESFSPDAVIHFAGLKSVSESIKEPIKYYENNVLGSLNLLKVMDKNDCNRIIFSSSATVYGNPLYLPIDEEHELKPLNPYGNSKLMIENILRDWATDQKYACALRYFNPIGADSSGIIGENPQGIPSNLVPYILNVINEEYEKLFIFGNDYDTKDGSGERDYIHVTDLVLAHMAALEASSNLAQFHVFNVGTGKGTTVYEIIDSFKSFISKDINYEISSRRPGDVASSVACVKKINDQLSWNSKFNIDDAIKSLLKWKFENKKRFI
jgi:UDP-glucose 4-epimerase